MKTLDSAGKVNLVSPSVMKKKVLQHWYSVVNFDGPDPLAEALAGRRDLLDEVGVEERVADVLVSDAFHDGLLTKTIKRFCVLLKCRISFHVFVCCLNAEYHFIHSILDQLDT